MRREPYTVEVAGPARREIENRVPLDVALACMDFILGPLADNPHRVGHRLNPPFEGEWSARVAGVYRLRYAVDDHRRLVQVLAVEHRRHAYRAADGAKRKRGR